VVGWRCGEGGQLLSCMLEGAAVSFLRFLMTVRNFASLSLSLILFVCNRGGGRSRSLIIRLWTGVSRRVPLGYVGELLSYPSVTYE
jgi:hypothetical protein